jgi:hypothetical protein
MLFAIPPPHSNQHHFPTIRTHQNRKYQQLTTPVLRNLKNLETIWTFHLPIPLFPYHIGKEILVSRKFPINIQPHLLSPPQSAKIGGES